MTFTGGILTKKTYKQLKYSTIDNLLAKKYIKNTKVSHLFITHISLKKGFKSDFYCRIFAEQIHKIKSFLSSTKHQSIYMSTYLTTMLSQSYLHLVSPVNKLNRYSYKLMIMRER